MAEVTSFEKGVSDHATTKNRTWPEAAMIAVFSPSVSSGAPGRKTTTTSAPRRVTAFAVTAAAVPLTVCQIVSSRQNESAPICLSGGGIRPVARHLAHVDRETPP